MLNLDRKKSNRRSRLSSSRVLTLAISSFFLLQNYPLNAETLKIKAPLKTVAITEIVAHPSLMQAKAGIIAELKKRVLKSVKTSKS